MALDLVQYESKARKVIREFWKSRDDAGRKQAAAGKSDQGERAGVTSGKNMDGFVSALYKALHKADIAPTPVETVPRPVHA